jgi:hypothetical protein
MPKMNDPPKRCFQLRLRTLMIVVTLFCVVGGGYVGWQAKIVADRRTMARRIMAVDKGFAYSDPTPPAASSIPWIRRLLGDEPVSVILLPITTSPTTRGEVHAVFPEAAIRAMKDADPMTHEREVIDFPAETEGK